MRIGTLINVPDRYSRYGRILDENGRSYTVDPGELPRGANEGDKYAFKVDLWSNDSGLAYNLQDD